MPDSDVAVTGPWHPVPINEVPTERAELARTTVAYAAELTGVPSPKVRLQPTRGCGHSRWLVAPRVGLDAYLVSYAPVEVLGFIVGHEIGHLTADRTADIAKRLLVSLVAVFAGATTAILAGPAVASWPAPPRLDGLSTAPAVAASALVLILLVMVPRFERRAEPAADRAGATLAGVEAPVSKSEWVPRHYGTPRRWQMLLDEHPPEGDRLAHVSDLPQRGPLVRWLESHGAEPSDETDV